MRDISDDAVNASTVTILLIGLGVLISLVVADGNDMTLLEAFIFVVKTAGTVVLIVGAGAILLYALWYGLALFYDVLGRRVSRWRERSDT